VPAKPPSDLHLQQRRFAAFVFRHAGVATVMADTHTDSCRSQNIKGRKGMFSTRSAALVLATIALTAGAARAQTAALEKPTIQLAVGGKTLIAYLPLTIAERRGYFQKEGLKVEISDFAGGAKALQALVGGSADVVCGAYEHTISMTTRWQTSIP